MDGRKTNSCSQPPVQLTRKILQLLSLSVSPATHATYKRAYESYLTFHSRHYHNRSVFPIKPFQLAQFIAFQSEAGYKGSSIQTQISGITFLQRIMGFENLADNFLVKKLLVSAHKTAQSPDKRLPITIPILRSLLLSLPQVVGTPFEVKLYKAMFLLAFFALLRVGEMATTKYGKANILQLHNIEILWANALVKGIRIHMQHHKHSKSVPTPLEIQTGKDIHICPVQALYNYMSIRGGKAGPLFLNEQKCPVSAAHFTATLHNCVKVISLDTNRYTPHSFRIGGASFAHENNFNDVQLRRLGRWHSTAYLRYIRNPVLTAKSKK